MVSFYDFETTGTSPAFDQPIQFVAIDQNLHPDIYQTRFNLNDRLDLMKVIHTVWDQAPDTLEWPLDDKDGVSVKPDRLAPANGCTAHNAHFWFSGFCPPCRSARHRVQQMGDMVLEDLNLMDQGLSPMRCKRAERETMRRLRLRPVGKNQKRTLTQTGRPG